MDFVQSIAAFIDILGFSNLVDADCERGETVGLSKVLRIVDAAAGLLSFAQADIRQFSDSLVCSAPYSIANLHSMLKAVQGLQDAALEQQVLLRGGIAVGKHYSDNRMVFSQALINSYRVESTIAQFPRVVLDENVVQLVEATAEADDLLLLANCCCKDSDGQVFVAYALGEAGKGAADFVRSQLDLIGAPRIREKYVWLGRYLCTVNAEAAHALANVLPEITRDPARLFGSLSF